MHILLEVPKKGKLNRVWKQSVNHIHFTRVVSIESPTRIVPGHGPTSSYHRLTNRKK